MSKIVVTPTDFLSTDFTVGTDVKLNTARLPPATVSSATAPTSPVLGQRWYDTGATPPVFKTYNGSAWLVDTGYDATDTAVGSVRNATAAQVALATDDGAVSISPKDLADALNATGAGAPNAMQQAIKASAKLLYARASMSATQNGVASGVFTTVDFDTTVANDIFTIPAAGNITITKSGRYRLFSQLFSSYTYDSGVNTSIGASTITVFVNGVYKEQGLKIAVPVVLSQTSGSQTDLVSLEYIADFVVGDVINIRGYLTVVAPNTYVSGSFNATTNSKLTMQEV